MTAKYPWSDLVALVTRFASVAGRTYNNRGRVLELGCGYNHPNLSFFMREGWIYNGVDLNVPSREFDTFGENWVWKSDFTKFTFKGPYDLICDRAALSHNPKEAIIDTIASYRNSLVKDGLYIGVDWFSTQHDGATRKIDDFNGYPEPYFVNEYELRHRIFPDDKWKLLHLEHKYTTDCLNPRITHRGFWNIVARRRG